MHINDREARALILAIDRYRTNPPDPYHPGYLSPGECGYLQVNIARTYLDGTVQGSEDARDAAAPWPKPRRAWHNPLGDYPGCPECGRAGSHLMDPCERPKGGAA